MATTLLEREAQLGRIDELIADAGGGTGGVISIEGVAGIGKTELLRAARERASGAGLNVLSARGGELERDMAFGVARQLLELVVVGGSDDEQAALLDGAAELARGALGLAGGHAASSDQFAVVHGLYVHARLARLGDAAVPIARAAAVLGAGGAQQGQGAQAQAREPGAQARLQALQDDRFDHAGREAGA